MGIARSESVKQVLHYTRKINFNNILLLLASLLRLTGVASLKGVLKSKLFSASGAALRLLDRDSFFKNLHKKFNRATPTQFQKYTTAISLYDLIKKETPED
jgi:hypothetical protein